jgi:hypothetical protein
LEKIIVASDHAGFRLKEKLVKWLISKKYEVKDLGSFSEDSVDYPDYAHPLSVAVEKPYAGRVTESPWHATSIRRSGLPYAGMKRLEDLQEPITMPMYVLCPDVF